MFNYFTGPTLNQGSIVAFTRGDVTGDRVYDNVFLTGTMSSDSPFVKNISLHVQNGLTGRLTSVPLPESSGYNPTIFLGDFTGNGVNDVFISIATGGSGGTMYHYIYSFVNNTAKLLFDSNVYNEQYKYKVTYQDFYKVEVISLFNKQQYIIDISLRDPEYLNEIYDRNGKLKKPISGFVNPVSGLYPVNFDYDKKYELLAYQRIAGQYNADSLGYVLNTLEWANNRFDLQQQYVAIFGS